MVGMNAPALLVGLVLLESDPHLKKHNSHFTQIKD
jgi:hypothetical protein